jgi:flagellar motor switch protein FliG
VQTQLKQTLIEYYKADSFLITVKAHLERIVEKIQTEENNDTDINELDLPGLPVSLPKDTRQTKRLINEKLLLTDRFKMQYVEVAVIVDKEIFSNSDITFVNRVVKMNPDVDILRGDVIKVIPIKFPVKEAALKAAEENMEEEDILAGYYPYIYTGAGLLLLLLLVVIILQIVHLKRTKKQNYEYNGFNTQRNPKTDSFNNQNPEMLGYSQMPGLPMTDGARENGFDQKQAVSKDFFYELRQLMVTTLIGSPELSAEIFKNWIDADNDDGIYKIAAFLKATDPKLLEVLSDYLGRELSAKVEFAINQVQSIDKESLSEVFKKFREEFQNEQSARILSGDKEEGDLFVFLKQLNPHQIYQLIKDEPLGIMAVALAQVSPETANEVINNMPQDKQLKIPVEIGKLQRIPISAYRDIAKKLSKNAMELEKIRYVNTDGINALVNMLEQSSPEVEEQLLSSVAEHDIALAEEIRKVYMTFDEITYMPDMILADVLRSFDRITLVKALINSQEEVRTKILRNLPPRTKIIVTDNLQTMQEEIPADDVYKARRIITQKFRDMAKTGKIDFKKYIK